MASKPRTRRSTGRAMAGEAPRTVTPAAPDAVARPATYRSAMERLRALGPTFSIEQLCLLQDLPREAAQTYVSRWMAAGHLRSAGPRVGFYANLVVAPDLADSDDWLVQALLHTYKAPVRIGASVLNEHGWITQHPHEVQVAVLGPANRSKVDGFEVLARPRTWFERVHDSLLVGDGAGGGAIRARPRRDLATLPPAPQLRSLPPALALADVFGSTGQGGLWQPDRDDLEVPEQAWPQVKAAFELLRVEMPQWMRRDCDAALAEGEAESGSAEPAEMARPRMRA